VRRRPAALQSYGERRAPPHLAGKILESGGLRRICLSRRETMRYVPVMLTMAALSQPLAADDTPWPAPVKDWVEPEPGEHPRLFFRKSDIPALRKKAETPEGKAILARLRKQLNGSDGQSLNKREMWTMSHVAGYGFLYTVTGDKRYADLGKQAMEQSISGAKRKDDTRYAFKGADGALRAGPALGWNALGYDLCYNGWDEAYRNRVRDALQNYNDGANKSLAELARGSRHGPHSNHWGMQIGGAAMALLALMNDPGVDMAKLKPLLEVNEKCMIRKLTEGFGDDGYFKEGDGTGSMGYIAFVPAIQAWRVAGGKDFYNPRPNAQWVTLRWILGGIVKDDGTILFHKRDGYKHNVWTRDGISGGNYFGIGFGVATPIQKAAWLWYYNKYFKALDAKNGTPYDTLSYYPHHSILSFVNWPLDIKPRDPAECIPRASTGKTFGYCMFRNQWKDENDIVVTVLTKRPRGHTKEHEIGPVWITASGVHFRWGHITGELKHSYVAQDGSGIIATSEGKSLAVDFSGACGKPAMIVLTGTLPGGTAPAPSKSSKKKGKRGKGGAPPPAAKLKSTTLELAGTPVNVAFLPQAGAKIGKKKPVMADIGAEDDAAGSLGPEPILSGGKIKVGSQTISIKDGVIVLGKIAPEWQPPE